MSLLACDIHVYCNPCLLQACCEALEHARKQRAGEIPEDQAFVLKEGDYYLEPSAEPGKGVWKWIQLLLVRWGACCCETLMDLG